MSRIDVDSAIEVARENVQDGESIEALAIAILAAQFPRVKNLVSRVQKQLASNTEQ